MLGDALKLIAAFRDTSPNDTLPNAHNKLRFFDEVCTLMKCARIRAFGEMPTVSIG
jgi:hypothetical protein